MIDVLIVEDSRSARLLLKQILQSDPSLCVIGDVGSGEEAIEFLKSKKPHVITMDIVMPGLDGFSTTELIMETHPVPIVIVSSIYKPGEVENSFRAMEAGAVAIIEKPVAPVHPEYNRLSKQFIDIIKIMSEVKVVTRFARNRKRKTSEIFFETSELLTQKRVNLIAIGASTGGPPVLQTLLKILPKDINAPILIVQHISAGFVEGLAQWLESTTGFPVHIPKDGEYCQNGHVYLAQDDFHMGITFGSRIILEKSQLENGQRPSVSFLFRSVACNFPGNAIAVLLTGMGNDGATELKSIKESGSLTIAQDEASSIVYGMPGEAVKLKAAQLVLSPVEIARTINDYLKK